MNIGIIGTAGRREDADKLSRQLFVSMIRRTCEITSKYYREENREKINLISGGAAVADHIAVMMFLANETDFTLSLFLPAPFDKQKGQFIENDDQFDSGRIANFYHQQFSKKCDLNSLEHISKAIDLGAAIHVGSNFKSRNTLVANNSDVLIALTFGDDAKLKDGGTLDTMTKFVKKKGNAKSYHVDIHTMRVYNPAEIS